MNMKFSIRPVSERRLWLSFWVVLAVFCCTLTLQAQAEMQMNLDQLVQFVRSEIALHHGTNDKQVAAYIKKIQLTEKLTDKVILDLETQGAGPKTVQALQELRDQTANLKPPTHDATYSPATAPDNTLTTGPATASLRSKAVFPPPNSERQQQILDAMKQYAMSYTQNLPNFMCVQVTRRYIDPNGSDHFRSLDTVLAKLSYVSGREDYRVYSVGDRMVEDATMESAGKGGGAISIGEFGSMMQQIFEPRSEAQFGWDHWSSINGRRMAVFNFFIDSGHSGYSITYGSSPGDEQRIITAYKGLIYADENTGEIARIKFIAVDIPRSFPVSEATEIVDYDQVDIGGQPYICPLMAQLFMRAGRESSKNQIEFRNYKKFGTESVITYDMKAPPPLVPSEEQPANAAPQPAKPKTNVSSDPFALPTLPPPPPPKPPR